MCFGVFVDDCFTLFKVWCLGGLGCVWSYLLIVFMLLFVGVLI